MAVLYDVLMAMGLLSVSFGMLTIYALLIAAGRADRQATRTPIPLKGSRYRALRGGVSRQ